eukprot:gnl/Dysnectes_brevis/3018_a3728_1437.p1 GENE.gnl/Dysnectes_brevis/3018_a3728_1437~~gnl/Dysnectes_brevis/3018_a3728_1437.p1  ORF type:complete len:225 (+),score=35.83 gnl/Dysnectes_brevis/3018_a3728_1437:26-700(+)
MISYAKSRINIAFEKNVCFSSQTRILFSFYFLNEDTQPIRNFIPELILADTEVTVKSPSGAVSTLSLSSERLIGQFKAEFDCKEIGAHFITARYSGRLLGKHVFHVLHIWNETKRGTFSGPAVLSQRDGSEFIGSARIPTDRRGSFRIRVDGRAMLGLCDSEDTSQTWAVQVPAGEYTVAAVDSQLSVKSEGMEQNVGGLTCESGFARAFVRLHEHISAVFLPE